VRSVAFNRRPSGTDAFDRDGLPVVGEDHFTWVVRGRFLPSTTRLGHGDLRYRFMQISEETRGAFERFVRATPPHSDPEAAMAGFVEAHPELLSGEISALEFRALRAAAREASLSANTSPPTHL
ncbi:MAG: hypothetical protein AAFQ82_28295, partial [Myxococcota bacterium]